MLALWREYAIWTPKNPKLMFHSCQNVSLCFSICVVSSLYIKYAKVKNYFKNYATAMTRGKKTMTNGRLSMTNRELFLEVFNKIVTFGETFDYNFVCGN